MRRIAVPRRADQAPPGAIVAVSRGAARHHRPCRPIGRPYLKSPPRADGLELVSPRRLQRGPPASGAGGRRSSCARGSASFPSLGAGTPPKLLSAFRGLGQAACRRARSGNGHAPRSRRETMIRRLDSSDGVAEPDRPRRCRRDRARTSSPASRRRHRRAASHRRRDRDGTSAACLAARATPARDPRSPPHVFEPVSGSVWASARTPYRSASYTQRIGRPRPPRCRDTARRIAFHRRRAWPLPSEPSPPVADCIPLTMVSRSATRVGADDLPPLDGGCSQRMGRVPSPPQRGCLSPSSARS